MQQHPYRLTSERKNSIYSSNFYSVKVYPLQEHQEQIRTDGSWQGSLLYPLTVKRILAPSTQAKLSVANNLSFDSKRFPIAKEELFPHLAETKAFTSPSKERLPRQKHSIWIRNKREKKVNAVPKPLSLDLLLVIIKTGW